MGLSRDMLNDLARLLRPMQVRVANSIARAVVRLADDGRALQLVQLGVLAGEDLDDCERFQPFGFSSVPYPGAEAVVLFPNGDRGHPLVVVVDDRRYRPTGLAPGTACVYSPVGVRLGSGDAAEGVIKGNARDTAEQAFLTALHAFVTAVIVPAAVAQPAKDAMLTAIEAFKTAATAAISAKVKTE